MESIQHHNAVKREYMEKEQRAREVGRLVGRILNLWLDDCASFLKLLGGGYVWNMMLFSIVARWSSKSRSC